MSSTQPEFLSKGAPAPARSRSHRKLAALGGTGVLVAGVVGAGAWGFGQLVGGGDAPDTAVPANAIVYVAIDLDPSAGQKIEALKALRKFPAARKGLGSRDDIRRWIYDVVSDGCTGVDYEQDVEPWLGDRAAFAAVPAATFLTPFVVLQVQDEAKARQGVKALSACAGGDDLGTAFVGDYVVVASKQSEADSIAADAKATPLAADTTYHQWIDRVGGSVVLTAYASNKAPAALMDMWTTPMEAEAQFESSCSTVGRDGRESDCVKSSFEGLTPEQMFPKGVPSDFPTELLTVGPDGKQRLKGQGMTRPAPKETLADPMKDAFADFEGMAASVRFSGDGLEANVVSKGGTGAALIGPAPIGITKGTDNRVGDLPAETAAVLGLAFDHGWLGTYVDRMDKEFGGPKEHSIRRDMERSLGVSLDQLEQMLGTSATVSVDPSVPADLLGLESPGDLAGVPGGIRIVGDPATVQPLLAKVIEAGGADAKDLVVVPGDGVVALGFNRAYAEKLAGQGSLGESTRFKEVVPDAGEASGVAYVDFNAGTMSKVVAHLFGDSANLEPLSGLGLADWTDGAGYVHDRLRLTTD